MDSYREIENLIYAYADLIDAGQLEDMAQLFSHAGFLGPDGRLAATGAREFLTLQRQAVKIYSETGTPRTKHVTTNVIIEIDESTDAATARSYSTVLQSAKGLALQPIIAGRYKDRFERVDGSGDSGSDNRYLNSTGIYQNTCYSMSVMEGASDVSSSQEPLAKTFQPHYRRLRLEHLP